MDTITKRAPEWRRPFTEATDALLAGEWLVTNGLGGYASGTIAGAVTRRYHGLLVAALPAPLGRTVMLNHLWEELRMPGGRTVILGGSEHVSGAELPGAQFLAGFRARDGTACVALRH